MDADGGRRVRLLVVTPQAVHRLTPKGYETDREVRGFCIEGVLEGTQFHADEGFSYAIQSEAPVEYEPVDTAPNVFAVLDTPDGPEVAGQVHIVDPVD